MIKKGFFLLLTTFFFMQISASIVDPVTWTFEAEKVKKNEYLLHYKAAIESPWNLYGMDIPEGGPRPTSFSLKTQEGVKIIDEVKAVTSPEIKFDPGFKMDIPMHKGDVIFSEKIKVDEGISQVKGVLEFMVCDDNSCLPPQEVAYTFVLDEQKTVSAPEKSDAGKALIWVFLIAFGGGILAIFTPCVFPMIPMIVGFFTQGDPSRAKVIRNALFFGFSMIAIYLSLGLVVSLLNVNPNVANEISSHWISNSLFFLIFVVFAVSFFGAFEIMLPGSLVNKSDKKAEKGGLAGTFFIALTTVIVAFSCTGPIIGAILIDSAGGLAIEPVIGMLGFAIAFSAPFTLLAFFPAALKKLPKSGGWMNTVKVVFAFLLLAFSLMFISNISQSYHLNIINRELYLSIWIVLSVLLGFYMIGKIRFAHDEELPFVSTSRIFVAIAVFSFAVYLFTGLLGNSLKGLATLLPPATQHEQGSSLQQEIDDVVSPISGEDIPEDCFIPKYEDFLDMPHGLTGYFDYQQGRKCAQEQGKPLLVVFKGHQCSACKEMENWVWPDVLEMLRDDFVLVTLFTDDRKPLPESEQYVSEYDGRKKSTVGKKFSDLQISKYKANTIPFYVLIDAEGNMIGTMGYTRDVETFRDFLMQALEDEGQDIEKTNVGQESGKQNVEVSEKQIFQF